MIAIHKHGLPNEFAEETIAEAREVSRIPLGPEREDLRHLPIVAIDPADEIHRNEIAFARRTTQWEQDTVVNRRMAYQHYFGAKPAAKPAEQNKPKSIFLP